jgi:preprotein translocase subunit YajC
MTKMLVVLIALVSQSQAWAQGAAPQPPENGFLMQLPVFAALFALFYFVMIRPQRQQAKKHAEFLSSLNRGDEVILANGFFGRIVGLTDKIVSVEIADGVEVKALRTQVQGNAKAILAAEQA